MWTSDLLTLSVHVEGYSRNAWCALLLVEETGVPGEKHRPVASN